ncbi:MAG: hypothetical protein QXH75_05440 [Sulfolobaceae archaeon]|jgi:hypothetical protein
MELKDECGCIVNRKYASDFLTKRMFLAKKKYDKICYFRIDNNRWFSLYKGSDGKIYYESSECPIVVITLEALCELYLEKNGIIEKDDAIKKLREIKGFTINEIVTKVVENFVSGVKNG